VSFSLLLTVVALPFVVLSGIADGFDALDRLRSRRSSTLPAAMPSGTTRREREILKAPSGCPNETDTIGALAAGRSRAYPTRDAAKRLCEKGYVTLGTSPGSSEAANAYLSVPVKLTALGKAQIN
jgi:hypothetical protein